MMVAELVTMRIVNLALLLKVDLEKAAQEIWTRCYMDAPGLFKQSDYLSARNSFEKMISLEINPAKDMLQVHTSFADYTTVTASMPSLLWGRCIEAFQEEVLIPHVIDYFNMNSNLDEIVRFAHYGQYCDGKDNGHWTDHRAEIGACDYYRLCPDKRPFFEAVCSIASK
jgi:hypothetical protein